jgi:hypothetical protein
MWWPKTIPSRRGARQTMGFFYPISISPDCHLKKTKALILSIGRRGRSRLPTHHQPAYCQVGKARIDREYRPSPKKGLNIHQSKQAAHPCIAMKS